MNVLWAGGVNNPMDSIEQLSYLIFLRLLSERDDQAAIIEKGTSASSRAGGRAIRGATSLPSPGMSYLTRYGTR